MASTTSVTGLGTSGLRGYGGLASGLDRDTLIEQMTLGTRNRIAIQKQRKQSLQWKQESYRSITSKLFAFTDNYLNVTSKKSFYNSALFSPEKMNINGANSKYVTASGNSSVAEKLKILGVDRLAERASVTTAKLTTTSVMETGSFDLDGTTSVPTLVDQSLELNYGGGDFIIRFGTGTYTADDGSEKKYDYNTPEKAVESMNARLKEYSSSDGKTLDQAMEFTYDSATNKFSLQAKSADNRNHMAITGGTAREYLGFKTDAEQVLTPGSDGKQRVTADSAPNLTKTVTNRETLNGKSLSFSYNGVTKPIELGTYANMDEMAADLQNKVDQTFGEGRIKVGTDAATGAKSGKLTFQTMYKDDSGVMQDDPSSVLKITGGSGDARSIMKVEDGASNRLNIYDKMDKNKYGDTLTVNGKTIAINENMSIGELVETINTSGANVKVTYIEGSDKFSIESTAEGASGKVEMSGNVADKLFKFNDAGTKKTDGKDASIWVDYGDGSEVELKRSGNTFDLAGLTVTVSGTFSKDDPNSAVTFKPEMDTEKATTAVTDFVKDFNELIDLINTEYTTKPNRDYAPLSDEQKKEMSEEEIKAWEKEAKKGLLFNDDELSSLSTDLRMILSGLDRQGLEKIGITTSNEWYDNGKLVLDETKFKAALQEDPEAVQKLFSSSDKKSGLADKLDNTIQKYAKKIGAYKGSLVQLAGATEAPLSLIKNTMYDQINAFDEAIEKLETRLVSEEDRYIKQFTTLENLISQMNSQSSWLSSQFG